MDEWENPNPIMLSERVAQRSAEEQHRAAHIGPKANVPEVPLAALSSKYLPGIVWAGSARQDSLGRPPWHGIKVPA